MSDDLLGQQQDDIARLRYELAKTIEGAPDYQSGTIGGLDVYRRAIELGQEGALREELVNGLKRLRPDFDPERFIDPIIQAIRDDDQAGFDQVYQKATIAAIFPNK